MDEKSVDIKVLRARAEQYCSRAERCVSEVQTMLKKYGATVRQTDEVIELLQQNGFVDEARYCRAFVHDKVAFDCWGRRKMQYALRAKHLPERAIEAALAGIDEATYKTNMLTLCKRHTSATPDKLMRFLLQRGYTYEDIRSYTKIDTEEDSLCE